MEMEQEDRQIGRVLSRRDMLAVLATASGGLLLRRQGWPFSAALAGETSASGCVVRPEQADGPYFVDEKLHRSDIRSDPASGAVSAGIPLQLTFRAWRADLQGCAGLAGATIDIWHCDANGVYSDARDRHFNTVGKKFLRGYQVTDASGGARFTTIFPGWYDGRTVHIHFKIRTHAAAGTMQEFTSQLYFDDGFIDRIHAQAPYAQRGKRAIRNRTDSIFGQGGGRLLLAPTSMDGGYAARFELALEVT